MTTVDEALTVHPGKIRSGAFSRRSAPAYTRTLAPDTGAGRAATRGEPGRVGDARLGLPAARARAPISSRPNPICALQHAYPVRARNPGPPAAICAREHVPGWAARTIAVAARGGRAIRGPRPGWAAAAVSDRGPGRPGDRGPRPGWAAAAVSDRGRGGRAIADPGRVERWLSTSAPRRPGANVGKPDRPPTDRTNRPAPTAPAPRPARATRAAATARPTAATAHRKQRPAPDPLTQSTRTTDAAHSSRGIPCAPTGCRQTWSAPAFPDALWPPPRPRRWPLRNDRVD